MLLSLAWRRLLQAHPLSLLHSPTTVLFAVCRGGGTHHRLLECVREGPEIPRDCTKDKTQGASQMQAQQAGGDGGGWQLTCSRASNVAKCCAATESSLADGVADVSFIAVSTTLLLLLLLLLAAAPSAPVCCDCAVLAIVKYFCATDQL